RLQEFEQRLIRRPRLANNVVRQNELSKIGAVEGGGWRDRCLREPGGFRVGVGIEHRIGHWAPARPEAATADFVRGGFAHDCVGEMRHATRMWWSGSTGESRDREVGCSPEKMHGARLANESRPKLLEDAIRLNEDPPESGDIFPIVGLVDLIL